ncbi:MAG: hypothetical protein WAQ98_21250 [Blastocatellia bacterium]
MNQLLTMLELKALYPSEWVLIVNPEIAEDSTFKRGKVSYHSKNKDEVYSKVKELQPKSFAVFYLGTIPEGMAVLI